MTIKLLYLENSLWEFDFIVNDILYNIEKDIEIFNSNNLNLLLNRPDIIENNILVINTVCPLTDIINVVKYIKPIIIFYMSDECGVEPNIMLLEKYTKLLFRQYNHATYNYSKNNYQLPLGYAKFFLSNTSINSFHSLLLKLESSWLTFFPKIIDLITFNPLEEISAAPTL